MRNPFYLLLFVWVMFGAVSVANAQKLNENPLLADPAIFLYKGTYYLYGTNARGVNNGFVAYTSADLKNWQFAGQVLKPGDAFGSRGFWAPQVFQHKNKFYMAYTADEHIAIAESKSPLGPFKQKEIKSLKSPGRMIDPFVFFDKGKIYFYHVRLQEGNRIFVAEMTDDLNALKEETAKECIIANEAWENKANANWPVAEGPTVFKMGKQYMLMYSANDFRDPHYAVGYAVSSSPMGPWKKYRGNPILSRENTKYNGPGHGDLLLDKKGNWNYIFHTHFNDKKVAPRKTALIQMSISKAKTGDYILKTVPETLYFLNSAK